MNLKFILTKELGRLARWLRLLGYDAAYFASDDMKPLFITAFNESRVVITKRLRMSEIKSIKVVYLRKDLLKDQISELRKKIRLKINDRALFTRCADCNREVYKIDRGSVRDIVPAYVYKTQKNFFQCPSCAKIFWKATHWDRAEEFVHEVCS